MPLIPFLSEINRSIVYVKYVVFTNIEWKNLFTKIIIVSKFQPAKDILIKIIKQLQRFPNVLMA